MAQTWRHLLFAHWPVPFSVLRPLVPPALTLETFDGDAWLAVTPFVATVRARTLPAIPGLGHFAELNVRTYVTLGERPGVYFFSLDAADALAVAVARALYSLRYFRARFRVATGSALIDYESRRTHRGAAPATFSGSYGPTGPVAAAPPGTLAHWLTERYCLYAIGRRGRVRRAEIHHPPWPLQPADVEIRRNTMTRGLGFELSPAPPVVHFSARLDVAVWPPETVLLSGDPSATAD